MPPKKNQACFSSSNHAWQTPEYVLNDVRKLGPIKLDPCTALENPVDAESFYTELEDGLARPWAHYSIGGIVFVNPPYHTKLLIKWIDKCISERRLGANIVFLGPNRPDQPWCRALKGSVDAWCDYPKRIRFRGAKFGAPFPSILGYWGDKPELFCEVFEVGSFLCVRSPEIIS